MTDTTIQSRADLWAQPISAEAPCGTSSRYDEEYEGMMTEIAKLESVHSTPNWDLIYNNASNLLQKKTKDMAALGGLCVALAKRDRFAGLAAGLSAYRTLFDLYGVDIFPWPNRRRGRASAYGWMIQHLTAEIAQLEPTTDEAEALQICLDCFDRLDDLLRPELADLHPRVGPLREHLANYLDKAGGAPRDLASSSSAPLEARTTAEGLRGFIPERPAGARGPEPVPPASPQLPAVEPFPPAAIHTEEQAREVVCKAAAAIRLAAAFFGQRAEELTHDKERIEEQIRQAENVLQLQRHADELLEVHGEERSDETPEDEAPE